MSIVQETDIFLVYDVIIRTTYVYKLPVTDWSYYFEQ